MSIRKSEINGPEVIYGQNGSPTAAVRFWVDVEMDSGRTQRVNIISTFENRMALANVVSDPDAMLKRVLEDFVADRLAAGWNAERKPELRPTSFELLELCKKRHRE